MSTAMRILAIETSCDETSAAVVEDGRVVRSNVVSSQIAAHAPFGGVVPEIASREHVRAIVPVVEAALREAETARWQIDAVASTTGPGLAGALLVGATFARAMAMALHAPHLPVNHLEGHIYSVWLTEAEPPPPAPRFPMLALIVSGGHTELVLMRGHGDYQVVGRTIDDAAGEAFDKVARLIGLSYPGGPAVERAAAEAQSPVRLPRAWLPGTLDFSFSGLKTAVLHLAYELGYGESANAVRGRPLPQVEVAHHLTADQVSNIAAGFQESVVDVLVSKTARAALDLDVASVALVGGVAANRALRRGMAGAITTPLFVAAPKYSTDNAAMIAAAAYFAPESDDSADVDPNLALGA